MYEDQPRNAFQLRLLLSSQAMHIHMPCPMPAITCNLLLDFFCSRSRRDDVNEATRVHHEIERELLNARTWKKRRSRIDVLILGCGNSGKSTVFKQLRLANNDPLTPVEIQLYRTAVYRNLSCGMRSLLEAMSTLDLRMTDEQQTAMAQLQAGPIDLDTAAFQGERFQLLQKLWKDTNVQNALREALRAGFSMPTNMDYFYSDLSRFSDREFMPSTEDIIRCYAHPNGIQETESRHLSRTLRLIDVNQQISDRPMWITHFYEVNAVLFMVDISAFDERRDDGSAEQRGDRISKSPLIKALATWKSICRTIWFRHTTFFLFFNKVDLFEERLRTQSIKPMFPDYDGLDGDVGATKAYFKKLFLKVSDAVDPQRRAVYTQFTNATDTKEILFVIAGIRDLLMS